MVGGVEIAVTPEELPKPAPAVGGVAQQAKAALQAATPPAPQEATVEQSK